VLEELVEGRRRPLEDDPRADVHVRSRLLLMEEGGVDGAQSVEMLRRHV
jgi:hypothetical protein